MASGNTPEEAILQSLCEIFERYAISEMYNKGLTPPTIPFEYFEGKSIYNKINYLTKDKGFELISFSLLGEDAISMKALAPVKVWGAGVRVGKEGTYQGLVLFVSRLPGLSLKARA